MCTQGQPAGKPSLQAWYKARGGKHCGKSQKTDLVTTNGKSLSVS